MWFGCHLCGSGNADNGGRLVGTAAGASASKSPRFLLPLPGDCGTGGICDVWEKEQVKHCTALCTARCQLLPWTML